MYSSTLNIDYLCEYIYTTRFDIFITIGDCIIAMLDIKTELNWYFLMQFEVIVDVL